MNIFTKFKFYREYITSIKNNKKNLESEFGIRIDRANRMYTVVNVPDMMGEPYNLRKSDIDKTSKAYLLDYMSKIESYLNSIGISELYHFYKPPQKVDKFSYLLVIGYKWINTVRLTNFIIFGLIPISILSIITLLIKII